MENIGISWLLPLTVPLILANAFFVAAEFAIVKIRVTQLRPLVKQGNWRARIAVRMVNNLETFISATQLGITLTTLALGAIVEPLVTSFLENYIDLIPIKSEHLNLITFALALSLFAGVQIVLAELAPKTIAIQRPRLVTLWSAPILYAFYYLFWPFIWILNKSANLMLYFMGISQSKKREDVLSPDELQSILLSSSHVHHGDEMIHKIMLKALQLKEITAEQIMVPRENVSVLWKSKPIDKNIMLAAQAGYSRMPVCDLWYDEVIGVVLIRELLWQYQTLGKETNLKSIMRPILTFLPKTKLSTMLDLFRKSQSHLAIVISEEDRMLGIVSFEDVLEEIVGDIRDELDIEKGPFFEVTPERVLVDGETSVRDVAIETGWADLSIKNPMPISKWLITQINRLPKKDEDIFIENLIFCPKEVSVRGVRRLEISLAKPLVSEEIS